MVFSQFRSQYPQGCIVTEMLSKVDGLHTFRATIKDNDIILTTATAADSDLETAEDRAIKRALTILGLTFDSYGIQATLMPQITQPLLKTATNSGDRFLTPIRDSINESIDESHSHQIDELINYEANQKYADQKYNANETESIKPAQVEQKIDRFKQEPIDLSNQLSQIMVEMERIGWTKQQGKEHLQRKYKKNSRDQLNASEVFDFLEYLKSQSDTF